MQKLLQLFFVLAISGACSFQEELNDQETNFPNTGHPVFEAALSPEAKNGDVLNTQETYYVYATRLNVRVGPSTEAEIATVLNMNDEVLVLSEEDMGFVEIEIVDSYAEIKPGYEDAKLYVAAKYLSKSTNPDERIAKAQKYFMIQNIASEKLRIYEKMCDDGNCQHKLVLETDVAVGEPGKHASALGYYHISSWHKFYQDGAGRYPSWYHPNYPMPPEPGAGIFKWMDDKFLPYEGAELRGAFGWFTAKVAPNSYYQWTHGTMGWGSDKKKFIDATRGIWANLFADPRSHGCTRTDNESIAYIRELLEVGTPIIKVYAREAYEDPSRMQYSEQAEPWEYILTKNGAQRDGQKADAETVLESGTPSSEILEHGRYMVDRYPNAKAFLGGNGGAKSGSAANVYGLKHEDMRGVFFVDSGKLANYAHPRVLRIGGYQSVDLPVYVKTRYYGKVFLPECPPNSEGRCAEDIIYRERN